MRELTLRLSIPAVGVALTSGIAGAALFEMVKGYSMSWLFTISVAGFFGFFWWTLREAEKIVSSRARMMPQGEDTRRRVLIMGLSPMAEPKIKEFEAFAETGDIDLFASPKAVFDAPYRERNETPPFLAWQQNVRAINEHRTAEGGPELVLVLPSEESGEQFTRFKDGMCKFLPGLRVERVKSAFRPEDFKTNGPDGKSYENYNYVQQGLQRAIEQARKSGLRPPATDADICIDITPGMKPFSVAAAVTTLNNELLLGYVANDGTARYYDAEVSFARGS